MKHQKIQWGRLFRRALALFMATLALWALLMAGGIGTAGGLLGSLGGDPAFVTGLLQAELGTGPMDGGPLSSLDSLSRLVIRQSPLLLSSQAAVAKHLLGSVQIPGPAGDGPTAPHCEDPEDPVQLPAVTSAPDGIIPRTIIPTSTNGYVYADGVFITNRSKQTIDGAALASAQVKLTLPTEGPQILIMHTHGCESYTPDGTDVYEESGNSRTLDTHYNVVRVGNEMKTVFEEMGLSVLHDETLYDYPSYNDAYTHSRAGVAAYLEQYPSIKIVLDIHRDALVAEDGTIFKAVTTIDGQPTAQVMLVMGTNDKGSFPNWQENLTLAFQVQQRMNTLYPTLARPIVVRSSHYNQFLSSGSLLVEVGCHGNTLQEAINGARLFARAAGQVLLELEE